MTNSIRHKSFRYLDVLFTVYVASLLISNIAATKLVQAGPLILDGGVILFPLIYIIDDILTEVYGYKYSRRATWLAFGVMVLATACFYAVIWMPPAAEYQNQAAFETVLGFLPRIVLASLLAFLVGSFVNSFILAKLKIKMQGQKLWLRLLASTLAGGFLDTTVFCIVAFGEQLSLESLINYILVGIGVKLLAEVCLMPVTYQLIKLLKLKENSDAYDTKTNLSPFKLKI